MKEDTAAEKYLPEEITDESPLIRNSHIATRVLGVSEKPSDKSFTILAVRSKSCAKTTGQLDV